LGIGLRNEYENRNCKKHSKPFNIEQIELLVNRSGNLDPLSKIDNTLINLNKKSEFEGQKIHIDIHKDYFYYHCRTPGEVIPLFKIIYGEGYIDVEDKIGAKRKY